MRNSSNIQNAKSLRRQRTTPWIAGIGPLSTIRASALNEKASAFATAGLPFLAFALFLGAFGAPDARAEISFPSQIPKTSDALTAIVKAVPGLDAAGIKNFKASGNSASAELNIKGEKVTLVVFKRTGVSKVLLAIVPDDFKLSAFLPIPSGTPADGIKPALPR